MSEISDAALVVRLQQRDTAAFAIFFETHADRVYRLALHLLGNEQDAEEIVQMTEEGFSPPQAMPFQRRW